jgi:type IV pilus assembly protein PilZ
MADANEADDRREYARQAIELKVEYKRLNTFFSDYTRNISRGGTFIGTARPLPVGTEFVFKLFIPRLDEPVRLRGQVQWVVSEDDVADDDGGEPGMGIRFVYRDDGERQAIERTIEKLMVDSLGQLLYSKLMDRGRAETGEDDGDREDET